MNWLADENVERQIVEELREAGHSVIYVAEESPGITDEALLRRAEAEGAILLTADREFREAFVRGGANIAGVVLLRLAGLSAAGKAALLRRVVWEQGEHLTVVTPRALRIRKRSQ